MSGDHPVKKLKSTIDNENKINPVVLQSSTELDKVEGNGTIVQMEIDFEKNCESIMVNDKVDMWLKTLPHPSEMYVVEEIPMVVDDVENVCSSMNCSPMSDKSRSSSSSGSCYSLREGGDTDYESVDAYEFDKDKKNDESRKNLTI